MHQLTPLDAQFLGVESARTFGHVGVLGVYDPSTAPDGTVSAQRLRAIVAERLHLLPPFRWRLVEVPLGLDLPYWVEDPDFDLDYHVRETAIPPPGDDRQVAEVLARIMARPLDRSRPLWEVYLVHGLRDGRIGLLTKVHHAVADGVSGREILTVLLDPTPGGRPVPGGERTPWGEAVPTRGDMLRRGLEGAVRRPGRVLRALPRAVPNLTDVPGANAFPGVPALSRGLSRLRAAGKGGQDPGILEVTTAVPPRTCFNGPISPHRSVAYGDISLGRIREIKQRAGTTVNDVLVAACASSLRAFLRERGELPDDPLVAMIPVSVRAAAEERDFGNRISFMVVPIPTDEPDAGRGLQRAHELLRSAKEHHAALPAGLLTDASTFVPPAVLALAARTTVDVLSRVQPPLNLVISNIPGPREPLYCAGARLEAAYPLSVVVDGVGLNITVLSYEDVIGVGIVTDREQIGDPWPLLDGIRRALDALEAA
jgi:WS/DGAT/MGAT family acyltransferase